MPSEPVLVRVVGRFAVVVVLDEPHRRETAVRRRGAGAHRAVVALRIALREDQVVVRVIQGVHAIVPVSAAEAALRQLELHDVVEVPPTAVHLEFAVVQHVVSRAQAWGDLLAPSEADAVESRQRVVGGQVFLVQAQAEIQRQAFGKRPVILHVEGVIPVAHFAGGADVVAQVHRAPQTLACAAVGVAAGCPVLRQVLGDNGRAAALSVGGLRDVLDVVPDVHIRRIVNAGQLIRQAMVEPVPEFQVVGAQEILEVRQVLAEAIFLPLVEGRRGVRSDVAKARRIHELRGQRRPVQRLGGWPASAEPLLWLKDSWCRGRCTGCRSARRGSGYRSRSTQTAWWRSGWE